MDLPHCQPTFNTLGVFDEESCRFFLRGLGERIVPFYPFFVGIEEVYSVLLEVYGRAQIADVLSVLHELLEDDDVAGGLGDDGDIWRSWRYSWRHRHDGLLMPSVARVGNFVLPPPTPLVIRRFKAENFATLYSRRSTSRIRLEGHNQSTRNIGPKKSHQPIAPEQRTTTPNASQATAVLQTSTAASLNHTSALECRPRYQGPRQIEKQSAASCRVEQVMDAEEDDRDSEQDFIEIGMPASLGAFNPSLCLTFDMVQPRPPLGESQVSLRGGDLAVCILQQITGRNIDHGSMTDAEGAAKIVETPASTNPSGEQRRSTSVGNLGNRVSTGELSKELRTPIDFTLPGIPVVDASQLKKQIETPNSHSQGPSEQSQGNQDSGEAPQQKRSSNRQARLIDGAIFTERARRAEEFQSVPLKNESADMESVGSSSVRYSWAGTRQKYPLRQSWLSGVRSLFRHDQQNRQGVHQRHSSSTSTNSHADRISRMSPSRRRVTSCASDASELPQKVNIYALGLDGAIDLPDSPPRSSVNLNKPLPLFPGEKLHRRSASSLTRTPSYAQSQTTVARPSTASTVSSVLSQISSRKDFRELTRELLKTDTMSHIPDLSPVREVDINCAPAYSQGQSLGMRSPGLQFSRHSYVSDMNANPFQENPTYPLTPTAPAPLSFCKASDPEKGYEARSMTLKSSMSHSQSEPNLQPFTQPPKTPKRLPVVEYHIPSHLTSHSSSLSSRPMPNVNARMRGRAVQRSEPPQRHLHKLDQNEAMDPKASPEKRSRSPVKRFFGFGKSASLKDIAGEPQALAREPPSDNVKQGGGRTWTNKLRHGFLISETHEDDGADPVVTQSPPQQSKFPVSLDPPYQAKLLSELELMLVVSANRFLLEESHAGRISSISLARLREAWTSMNRPQVIEFQYDLLTQRELVMVNFKTLKLRGQCGENPVVLNAAMYGWKTMAKEMSVRTFCQPDSVIRKWLHDSHKIFEMLGTGIQTFLAFQDLQVKTLTKINEEQRKKMERKQRNKRSASCGSQRDEMLMEMGTAKSVRQMALSPAPVSQTKLLVRKATGAEGVIEGSPSSMRNRDAYENSRGGRLGLMVRGVDK